MASDEKDSTYNEELNLRHQRFLALGGGTDLQMDMKAWTPLADLVTPLHRKIVYDLAAAGLSNELVAEAVGISKERLQALFGTELKTAYQLCHASLARSLYYQGIAGDQRAASDWLKYHNRSTWGTKTQVSGTEEGAPIKTEDTGARSIVNALLAGMLTDKTMRGPVKSAPPQKQEEIPAPRRGVLRSGKPKVIKKVRQEQ
jgi:hypothetical protein